MQVDERKVVNFGTAYSGAANSVNVVGYADANTYAGADPNPMLDADDEIAFMARDTGGRPPSYSTPAGVVASTGVEVLVADPLELQAGTPLLKTGTAYLFRRSAALDPAAGKDYVDYQFQLASGDYKTTYKFQDGPNPENSTITTPYYQHHFGDRWMSDSIKVTAPGASGVDILDRHKNLFAPGNCGRSENTFNDAEGAFIVNKNGPVRAIRSYIGANSGPNTQREHIFYDRREDVRTFLRVHAIPGVMDFFDYSPEAIGHDVLERQEPGGRHDRRRPGHAGGGNARMGEGRRPAGRAHERRLVHDELHRRRPPSPTTSTTRHPPAVPRPSAPATRSPTDRAAIASRRRCRAPTRPPRARTPSPASGPCTSSRPAGRPPTRSSRATASRSHSPRPSPPGRRRVGER